MVGRRLRSHLAFSGLKPEMAAGAGWIFRKEGARVRGFRHRGATVVRRAPMVSELLGFSGRTE